LDNIIYRFDYQRPEMDLGDLHRFSQQWILKKGMTISSAWNLMNYGRVAPDSFDLVIRNNRGNFLRKRCGIGPDSLTSAQYLIPVPQAWHQDTGWFDYKIYTENVFPVADQNPENDTTSFRLYFYDPNSFSGWYPRKSLAELYSATNCQYCPGVFNQWAATTTPYNTRFIQLKIMTALGPASLDWTWPSLLYACGKGITGTPGILINGFNSSFTDTASISQKLDARTGVRMNGSAEIDTIDGRITARIFYQLNHRVPTSLIQPRLYVISTCQTSPIEFKARNFAPDIDGTLLTSWAAGANDSVQVTFESNTDCHYQEVSVVCFIRNSFNEEVFQAINLKPTPAGTTTQIAPSKSLVSDLAYPNPSMDFVYLNDWGYSLRLEKPIISSINGKLIPVEAQREGQQWKIDIHMLPAGIYNLRYGHKHQLLSVERK
jgi:hypothetical protein